MGAGLVGRGQDGRETVEISNRAVEVSKPSPQAGSQIKARPGASFNVQRALSNPWWKDTHPSVFGPLRICIFLAVGRTLPEIFLVAR